MKQIMGRHNQIIPLSAAVRARRGVTLLIVLGVMAILFLIIMSVIGQQALTASQTRVAALEAMGRAEEQSAIASVVAQWRARNMPGRVERFMAPLNDVAASSETISGLAAWAESGQGANGHQRIRVEIRRATWDESVYRECGFERNENDAFITCETFYPHLDLIQQSEFYCREGDARALTRIRSRWLKPPQSGN